MKPTEPLFDEKLLRDRSIYPFFVPETVRYRDCDTQGHVNNAVYATYFEIGRGTARRQATRLHGGRPKNAASVVARQVINYHFPLEPQARIDIGSGLLRIGRTSFTWGIAVFLGDKCAASGEVVQVVLDKNNGNKPMPISDEYRRELESMLLRLPKA